MPISESAINWLQRYREEVRTGFAIEPDPHNLFFDKTGLPITPDQLSRRVTRYPKEADIFKSGDCHVFRHTVAALMPDNGAADIRFYSAKAGAYEYPLHRNIHPCVNRESQASP